MDNTSLVIRPERPPQRLLSKFKYFLLFAILFIFAGIALEPGVEHPYSGSTENMEFLTEQMRMMRELNITNTTLVREILLDFRFNCSRLGIEGLDNYYTLHELRDAIYSNDTLRGMIDFVYSCMNYAIVSGRIVSFVASTTTDMVNDIAQRRIANVLNDPIRASTYFVVILIYFVSISFIYYIVKIAANATTVMRNMSRRAANNQQAVSNVVNIHLPEGMSVDDVIRRVVELRNSNRDAAIIINNAEDIANRAPTSSSSNLSLRGGALDSEYGITKEQLDYFCDEIGLDDLSDFLQTNMESKQNIQKNLGGKRRSRRHMSRRRRSRHHKSRRHGKRRRTMRKR